MESSPDNNLKAGGISFTNKELKQLIFPLVLEQLLSITVGLADSIMVARVGEAAVSAVSLVDSISNLMIQVFAALATGGAVVAGQYIGLGQTRQARESGKQLLRLLVFFSLIVTALLYALKAFWLRVLFGAVEPDVGEAVGAYYGIVMASIPFIALYNGGAALFRTMQKSRATMRISLFMNLMNTAGNAILIFGFEMGVTGVAIPTLGSRVVSAVILLALLFRPEQALCIRGIFRMRPKLRLIRSILFIGIPGGVESTMFHFGRLMLTSIIAGMGTSAITANAIGNTVGVFHIFAAQSIGLGMVTIVSQCIGAGETEQARFYTRKLMRAMFVAQAAVNLLLGLAMPLILRGYRVTEETARLALMITLLHSVFSVLLYPPAFGLCNTLRAAGDARYVMLISSLTMWIGRIFAGYLLSVWCGWGIMGIWLAQAVLDWGFRAILFVARYRGSEWENKKLPV